MPMITAMSTRGQIVLPKRIRTELNLSSGTQFVVFSDKNGILLRPIAEPDAAEFESLLRKARKWAKTAGMKKSDIAAAISAVRKKS